MSLEDEQAEQRLYIAVIVLEMAPSSPGSKPLYQEEISVIEAASDEAARAKAIAHGKSLEDSYQNVEGETVQVGFKALIDVQEALDTEFKDGCLVYARHFRNYEAYESFEPLLKGEEL